MHERNPFDGLGKKGKIAGLAMLGAVAVTEGVGAQTTQQIDTIPHNAKEILYVAKDSSKGTLSFEDAQLINKAFAIPGVKEEYKTLDTMTMKDLELKIANLIMSHPKTFHPKEMKSPDGTKVSQHIILNLKGCNVTIRYHGELSEGFTFNFSGDDGFFYDAHGDGMNMTDDTRENFYDDATWYDRGKMKNESGTFVGKDHSHKNIKKLNEANNAFRDTLKHIFLLLKTVN